MLNFWPKRQGVGPEEPPNTLRLSGGRRDWGYNNEESLSGAGASPEHLMLVMGPELGERYFSCCQDRCISGSSQQLTPWRE